MATAPTSARSGWTMYLPPLPREHGSWAALLLPVGAAAMVLGVSGRSLLLTAAAGVAFFGRAAWQVRGNARQHPWADWWLGAWAAAAALLVGLLLPGPGGPALALVATTGMVAEATAQWLGRRGGWQSLAGDLAGATESALLVVAYALARSGAIGRPAWELSAITLLFWVGSTFRVRAQLRERLNPRFRWLTLAVHVLAMALAGMIGGLLGAVLVVPLLHAAWLNLKLTRPGPSLQVGVREIGHAVLFVVLVGVLHRI